MSVLELHVSKKFISHNIYVLSVNVPVNKSC